MADRTQRFSTRQLIEWTGSNWWIWAAAVVILEASTAFESNQEPIDEESLILFRVVSILGSDPSELPSLNSAAFHFIPVEQMRLEHFEAYLPLLQKPPAAP
jgi:hypothetical protein